LITTFSGDEENLAGGSKQMIKISDVFFNNLGAINHKNSEDVNGALPVLGMAGKTSA